jgi:hypothetical protein
MFVCLCLACSRATSLCAYRHTTQRYYRWPPDSSRTCCCSHAVDSAYASLQRNAKSAQSIPCAESRSRSLTASVSRVRVCASLRACALAGERVHVCVRVRERDCAVVNVRARVVRTHASPPCTRATSPRQKCAANSRRITFACGRTAVMQCNTQQTT